MKALMTLEVLGGVIRFVLRAHANKTSIVKALQTNHSCSEEHYTDNERGDDEILDHAFLEACHPDSDDSEKF